MKLAGNTQGVLQKVLEKEEIIFKHKQTHTKVVLKGGEMQCREEKQ
jgi:hypothetical protein